MKKASHTPPSIVTEAATFIGIDYYKKYSVWHAVDAAGSDLGKGRIEHHSPHDFATLIKRFASTRMGEGMKMNGRECSPPFFRLLRFFFGQPNAETARCRHSFLFRVFGVFRRRLGSRTNRSAVDGRLSAVDCSLNSAH